MKKIILIFAISLLCIGCGKTEKNVTINIYENSEIKEEQKEVIEHDKSNEVDQNIKTNEKVQEKSINIKEEQIQDKVVGSDTQNNIEETNSEQSTIDKVKDKVKTTYNSAKDWYNTNKDELKDINSEIIENDKNTINSWIDKTKSWYEENKDELKSSAEEIYNSDKETLEDLYNKIKN